MLKLAKLIAMIAIACLHVSHAHAQGVEPPRTSGEGDLILQEIAHSSTLGPPVDAPVSSGRSDQDQEGVLLPVTGGLAFHGSHRHSPSRSNVQAATQKEVSAEESLPILALSFITAGGFLVAASLVIRRRSQIRRRRHYQSNR